MSGADLANSGARRPRAACVVMASGLSTRYGSGNKLLETFMGRPLFEWTLDAIPANRFTDVVVVTPYAQIARSARIHGFDVVVNDDPRAGAGYSLRLGLRHARHGAQLDACMFCVCDQPFLQASSLERLLDGEGGIRALGWMGKRGNPVVFDCAFFDELADGPFDRGGSSVIGRHPDALRIINAGCALELSDVDTAQQALKLSGLRNLFLAGPRRAGKSTLLSSALEQRGLFPTGCMSLPYTVGGRQAGHYLHALSSGVPSEMNDKPISVRIGEQAVGVPEVFDRCGALYVRAAIGDAREIILLDELGLLEEGCGLFQRAVAEALESPKTVLGVMRDGGQGWLLGVRSRLDTLVVHVDQNSRKSVSHVLAALLDAALGVS